MAESPERAAQWDNAAVGEKVDLIGPDCAPCCGASISTDGGVLLFCTRDDHHSGDHVATAVQRRHTAESAVTRRGVQNPDVNSTRGPSRSWPPTCWCGFVGEASDSASPYVWCGGDPRRHQRTPIGAQS